MNNSKWPAKAVSPVAPPGLKFIFPAILITGVFFYLGWMLPAILCLCITVFICWFFRDPEREIPQDPNCLVSPADGKVIIIEKTPGCEYFQEPCIKVSIFMNVFNVHVNRMPFEGVVEEVKYSPGKFVNASFDKASTDNERNALIIRTPANARYAVVQIAGLIARRIVNCINQGESLAKGKRYGMIQFGSRLDLFLPENFDVAVKLGDKTKAGSTVIGYMN